MDDYETAWIRNVTDWWKTDLGGQKQLFRDTSRRTS